ncbi:MAG: hypothetical protein HN350_09880, partial [Phycisphaerales bacterium]|nr:hypothetical protein [Phycisphaerales bacterium]
MRTADAIIIVTMLLLVVQPAWAENAADDVERFAVTWRDGSVSRAAEIPGWRARSGKRLEDLDITFKRPEINGRKLFNPENLARIVSDTTLQSKLTGPFIEFANGDILPGYIVPDLDVGASGVTVLISDPLFTSDWRKGVVRVRTDWIMRVVRSDSGPNAHVTAPGTVILRDKTRLVANAVTWRPGGLRLLLGSSVRTVPWTQIADFHAPGINRTAAVLRDASAGAASKTDFLCRMSVTNGAVLSYHSSRLQIRKRHRQCLQVVQPIWAMNAICVQPDQVVTESYRPVDELPLSLLNAEPLTQKSMTGFIWPWRRDCGLRGQRLSSGTIQADLGVAMHSHSEIAFDLPAGAKSFSSWVGIDRAVRKGGCVRCKIYRDKVSDKPLWGSGIMLG